MNHNYLFIIKKLETQKFRPNLIILMKIKKITINNFKTISNNIENMQIIILLVKFSSLNIENDYNLCENIFFYDLINQALNNKSKILIDAENYNIQENINDISNIMIKDYNINEVNVFKTYQYRKDSFGSFRKRL